MPSFSGVCYDHSQYFFKQNVADQLTNWLETADTTITPAENGGIIAPSNNNDPQLLRPIMIWDSTLD